MITDIKQLAWLFIVRSDTACFCPFLYVSLPAMAVKTWRKWASGLHGCRQAAYGVPEMQTRCQRRGLSVLFSLFGSMGQTRQHSSNHLLESYVTSFLACPPRKGVPSFAVLPEGSSSSILGGSFTSPDRGSKVRRNQSQAYCGRQLQRLLPHPESRLPRAPHHANTSLIYKYCSLAHTVLHLIILSAAYLSANPICKRCGLPPQLYTSHSSA